MLMRILVSIRTGDTYFMEQSLPKLEKLTNDRDFKHSSYLHAFLWHVLGHVFLQKINLSAARTSFEKSVRNAGDLESSQLLSNNLLQLVNIAIDEGIQSDEVRILCKKRTDSAIIVADRIHDRVLQIAGLRLLDTLEPGTVNFGDRIAEYQSQIAVVMSSPQHKLLVEAPPVLLMDTLRRISSSASSS